MKAPRVFKIHPKRTTSYGMCEACQKWVRGGNALFHHEGRDWALCRVCFEDYWENTDALLPDYKWNWL